MKTHTFPSLKSSSCCSSLTKRFVACSRSCCILVELDDAKSWRSCSTFRLSCSTINCMVCIFSPERARIASVCKKNVVLCMSLSSRIFTSSAAASLDGLNRVVAAAASRCGGMLGRKEGWQRKEGGTRASSSTSFVSRIHNLCQACRKPKEKRLQQPL